LLSRSTSPTIEVIAAVNPCREVRVAKSITVYTNVG